MNSLYRVKFHSKLDFFRSADKMQDKPNNIFKLLKKKEKVNMCTNLVTILIYKREEKDGISVIFGF